MVIARTCSVIVQLKLPSAIVTSIPRATSGRKSFANKADTTGNFIERGIWTLIEANAGIIGACLPALRQPLAQIFSHFFESIVKGSESSDNRSPAKGHSICSTYLDKYLSHPEMWRPVGHSRQVVSISAPQSPVGRKSDEQCHIDDVIEDNDSGSDTEAIHGISKTADVLRTSFHMDQGVSALMPKMPQSKYVLCSLGRG